MSPWKMLAIVVGCLLHGSTLQGSAWVGTTWGLTSPQEDKLGELRKLRRERRLKEAEAKALKKDADEESRKREQSLQANIKALGDSIRRILPDVLQPLLADLKGGPPEAVAAAMFRLAEVGAPTIPELNALVKSGTPDVQSRIQEALQLIQDFEAGDDGLWKQWAVSGRSSSRFSRWDEDGWSAKQACGKPDTEEAAHIPWAWTSQAPDRGKEWIELTYAAEVHPSRIRVRETFNPGAVVKIEARDSEKNWQELWAGKDETATAPGYLEVAIEPRDFATRVIRITLDTRLVPGWNAIDAVQVIGEPTGAPNPDLKKPLAKVADPKLPPFKAVSRAEAVRVAVQELLKMQEENGRWNYEVLGEAQKPKGVQVGGTALIAEALFLAEPDDKEVQAAVQRALAWVLQALDGAGMGPLTRIVYDYRIWGHLFSLEFFCRLRARDMAGEQAQAVKEWIPRLVETILKEQHECGGWNYGGDGSASFVTAPVVQSLLLARSQGEKVPDEIFERARKALEESRGENGAYVYKDVAKEQNGWDRNLPDSAGRSVLCESTLVLLGGSSTEALQFALDNFHRHWNDLALRRQQGGTHAMPWGIAPYYFYYAHRYAAQLVELLPEEKRAPERERLFQALLKTRDEDGTWNDRTFKRSRNVGTALSLLVLLAEKAPPPPKLVK